MIIPKMIAVPYLDWIVLLLADLWRRVLNDKTADSGVKARGTCVFTHRFDVILYDFAVSSGHSTSSAKEKGG